jgi:hypothetical protein
MTLPTNVETAHFTTDGQPPGTSLSVLISTWKATRPNFFIASVLYDSILGPANLMIYSALVTGYDLPV